MKTTTVKTLRVFGAIVCGVLLASAALIAMRLNAPPLSIVRNGARVTVDVSTLGEYPTTVTRIRLSELNSGAVVWELSAAERIAQIHGFTLAEGVNPVQIDTDYGSYRTVVPSGSTAFVLRRTARYRLELWGGSSVLTKTSASFDVDNVR